VANPIVRIANAQGFWGDRTSAAADVLRADRDIDYITLDYLAEVSLSILARQKASNPSLGYARDFIDALQLLLPEWTASNSGRRARVVTNAGGLSPRTCAEACRDLLQREGMHNVRIAVVTGDDLLPLIRREIEANPDSEKFSHLEDSRAIGEIADSLTTANAYLGAQPLVKALATGADLVIAGRVADPSLTVAPCIHHFGWNAAEYDRLAGATVAGHLIECGTQVTGGISTDWLSVRDPANIGFPIVEVDVEGNLIVTKPRGTGGTVTQRTVKEQLLYEIGDPDCYLSPDATVSFLSLAVEELGNDRVRVTEAKGRQPPETLKVSATYLAGYKATGNLTIIGPDAKAKAQRCGEVVHARLLSAGCGPQRWLVEYMDGLASSSESDHCLPATVLRLSAADTRRDVVERFTREIMPLVTAGPQGTTGYASGRPHVQEVYGYWPCAIPTGCVKTHVEVLEV
jgi:hypothetical protein